MSLCATHKAETRSGPKMLQPTQSRNQGRRPMRDRYVTLSHSSSRQSSFTRPPVSPLLRFQHQKNLRSQRCCTARLTFD